MTTALKIGPGDRGRILTDDEFFGGDYEEGYRYELIDGRLTVSPMPNVPHDWVTSHVYDALRQYSRTRPDVVNQVSFGARVFVPDAVATTAPEPDVAAYADFPHDRLPNVDWRDVEPLIVVEVMDESVEKDLVRNADLYLRVPGIREYWVFDIRDTPAEPTLMVHSRVAEAWARSTFRAGDLYRTAVLPDFALPVQPA